ncbi:HprK-related kinase A [Govanella unica]|uniref:HprK-related kinase A n=1 Tax=Govanella unica TaxID=2975056 RepID=A0A9X3Z6Z1_9PROT|nr:HprK-related kinase A [Govania unica]MDA5193621.1 HprK-related kinase A [Govania unica]
MRGEGLAFRVGPFSARVQCAVPAVARDILSLYTGYATVGADDFIDYHLKVRPVSPLRRWVRPSVMADAGMVNTPFVPLPADIGVLAHEMGLNWLIATTADDYLIFHAGIVEKNGRTILMPGASGSGKSTLTAGLAFSGWRLFSDEFAVLHPESFQFFPYPRPVSLKNSSIPVLGERIPDSQFSRIYEKTPKGTIRYLRPSAEALARDREPGRPFLILYPEYRPDAAPQAIELPKPEAFAMVRSASVNCDRLGALAFTTLADLADQCRAFRLVYRSLDQGMAMVNDLAEQFA